MSRKKGFCKKDHSNKAKVEYKIFPLYPEELQFKLENDAEALINLFDQKGIDYKIVDINRMEDEKQWKSLTQQLSI